MSENTTEKINLPKFHLAELFPDPKSIFFLSIPALNDVINDALIVLDTNSLIIPYTIHQKSLKEIKGTYQRLIEEQRLFIPAQVSREFARIRANKIRELFQVTSLKQNFGLINIRKYPLLDSLDDYQKLIELEKEINKKISEYRKKIKPILNYIRSWKWNDPVTSIYRELLKPELIIDTKLNNEDVEKDFERRLKNQVPPGYKDAGKEDGGIGDIIIWNTILDLGREKKKPLIFVTGEEKADWMLKSEKEALYPRFELIDEYSRCSEGNPFYILQFSELLDLFGVEADTVEEVKKEETNLKLIDNYKLSEVRENRNEFMALINNAERAVYNWLSKIYSSSNLIENNRGFPDFIVELSSKKTFGFEIKVAKKNSLNASHKIKESKLRAFYEIQEGRFTDVAIVLVCEDEETAIRNISFLQRGHQKPTEIAVIVGFLDAVSNFCVIHNEFSQTDEF